MGRAGPRSRGQPPLGRRRCWPEALLGASILSSCLLLTQAQEAIPITWTPQYPRTGQNMTLRAGGTLENVVSCSWYRGTVTDVAKRILMYYLPPLTQGQDNGRSYTGRETAGPDCSLHIRNLTLNDSGNYTLSKEGAVTAIGHVTIEVSASILSSCLLLTQAQEAIPITWTPQYPTTGQNMTLRAGGTLEKVVCCSWFRGTVTDVAKRILRYSLPPLTQGQDNGPSYTGRETVDLDCSLHIQNLTLNDSGNYTLSKDGAVTAIGHATIEVSVPVQDNTSSRPVSMIIIVSLAATLALIGSLLCVFLCARCRKNRMSTQAITAPSLYENVPASGQVKKGNSSEASNVYETLQPGSENVYHEMKG